MCTVIVRIIFCSHSSMTLLYSVVCISIMLYRMHNIGISTKSAIPLFLFALIILTDSFILVFGLVSLVIGLVSLGSGLVFLVTALVSLVIGLEPLEFGLVTLVTGIVPLVVLC